MHNSIVRFLLILSDGFASADPGLRGLYGWMILDSFSIGSVEPRILFSLVTNQPMNGSTPPTLRSTSGDGRSNPWAWQELLACCGCGGVSNMSINTALILYCDKYNAKLKQ